LGDGAQLGRLRRLGGRGKRVARRLLLDGRSPAGSVGELDPDVALLVESPLFDHVWYQRQTGRKMDRVAAAHDYLSDEVLERGFRPLPHPLFEGTYYVEHLTHDQTKQLGETDPFVFYLRNRTWRRPTHPLFDPAGYLRRNKDAKGFRGGPLAHYDAVGRLRGAQPNDWMPPVGDDEYPDLREWLERRYDECDLRARQASGRWRAKGRPAGESALLEKWAGVVPQESEEPAVTVVVQTGLDIDLLRLSLKSLAEQSLQAIEVVAVDLGVLDQLDSVLAEALPERVRVVAATPVTVTEGVADAVATARGRYVTVLKAGDSWHPDRLRLLTLLADEQRDVLIDTLVVESPRGRQRFSREVRWAERGCLGPLIDSANLFIRRTALVKAGGVSVAARGAWALDLLARCAAEAEVVDVPLVGVQRAEGNLRAAHWLPASKRPAVYWDNLDSPRDVVLNENLIDWSALAARDVDPSVVSVIIPTYDDWEMTWRAVDSVLARGAGERRVECIVWDNGSRASVSATLDGLAVRFPEIKLVHSPVNHGFALGNNRALVEATGATVVFLNNDTEVRDGWLDALVAALDDPEVLAAQSLLVYPSGSIQSAGVVFPTTGGLPYAFLQGFPREDAAQVGAARFSALTGAALAVRWDDVVALHGFDPLFTNGMEDLDLCHRLQERRSGTFRVVPESVVVHHESRSPGRYLKASLNRRIYRERWSTRLPVGDDVRRWEDHGFSVVGREIPLPDANDRSIQLPLPVLVRTARLDHVGEMPPRLRWAIKNPAPATLSGDAWGDTHFAAALADALREIGQEVVVDRNPEFNRRTGRHDDVVLVLRGLTPYSASPENVTIGWVISHPEMLGPREAVGYDRLVAASVSWSQRMSAAWGIRIDPVLQATDPRLFHPDLAVPDTGHAALFVGSSRNVYREIVRDAVEAGLPLSIYGGGWKGFVPPRFIQAEYLQNTELGAAYRSAGTVLNDHWADMRDEGFLSNRLFDAVAAGARVVTDDVAGLRDVFGDSVQVYRDRDDLVRLTSLARPAEVFGDDVALRAESDRIRRDHSFRARAEQLLAIATELRAERGFSA